MKASKIVKSLLATGNQVPEQLIQDLLDELSDTQDELAMSLTGGEMLAAQVKLLKAKLNQ